MQTDLWNQAKERLHLFMQNCRYETNRKPIRTLLSPDRRTCNLSLRKNVHTIHKLSHAGEFHSPVSSWPAGSTTLPGRRELRLCGCYFPRWRHQWLCHCWHHLAVAKLRHIRKIRNIVRRKPWQCSLFRSQGQASLGTHKKWKEAPQATQPSSNSISHVPQKKVQRDFGL